MHKSLTIVEWGMFALMPLGFYLLFRAMGAKSRRNSTTKALIAGSCMSAPFIYLVAWGLLRGTAFEIPSNMRVGWRGQDIALSATIAIAIVGACYLEVQKAIGKSDIDATRKHSQGRE